jgi:hypothetical protein
LTSREWPALPFKEWEQTCDTLHLWTQIVGKTRLKLTPHIQHWWNVTLYVNPHGLTTSPMPIDGQRNLEIQFDLVDHVLHFVCSDGMKNRLPLFERSVADFYHQYMACMKSFGVELEINTTPDEFDDRTPFDEDEHHASYDRAKAEDFHRILLKADDIFKEFRSRFIGKSSPVHFFWGSFDLAVTRFCGRENPSPPSPSKMMREAYSHEVNSCGWWPGNRQFPEPAFYAYHVSAPAGFAEQRVRPEKAYWDTKLGEFILRYEHVRNSSEPERDVMDFCQSTYEAGANLAKWDRKGLERAEAKDRAKA